MFCNANSQVETSENFSNPRDHTQTVEIIDSEITNATPTRVSAPKLRCRKLIIQPDGYSPE